MYVIINKNEKELYMIDLKEKTDDIKELEIPEIKKENNEENIDNQQIVVTEKKSKKWTTTKTG